MNRVIQTCGTHCHFCLCGFSPCPLNPEDPHPSPENYLKMKIPWTVYVTSDKSLFLCWYVTSCHGCSTPEDGDNAVVLAACRKNTTRSRKVFAQAVCSVRRRTFCLTRRQRSYNDIATRFLRTYHVVTRNRMANCSACDNTSATTSALISA